MSYETTETKKLDEIAGGKAIQKMLIEAVDKFFDDNCPKHLKCFVRTLNAVYAQHRITTAALISRNDVPTIDRIPAAIMDAVVYILIMDFMALIATGKAQLHDEEILLLQLRNSCEQTVRRMGAADIKASDDDSPQL